MAFLGRKCQTLMLKNWLVRKHHPILTLLDILCPLGLFYFLAYLRNSTGVIQTGQRHNATIYNYTTEADIINFSEPAEIPMATVYFGYAPVTPFTTEFIRQFNSTALGKKMAAKYGEFTLTYWFSTWQLRMCVYLSITDYLGIFCCSSVFRLPPCHEVKNINFFKFYFN